MSRGFWISLALVSMLGAALLTYAVRSRRSTDAEFQHQVALATANSIQILSHAVLYSEFKVPAGNTFTESLEQHGIAPVDVATMIGTARTIYDLKHVRAGNRLSIGRSVMGELRAIRYEIDADRMLELEPSDRGFAAHLNAIPSHLETVTVRGEIRDSLFNAVSDAGESPELALRLAQIFGWDMDFYTDPREGDTFRVVVEKKKYLDGRTSGYERILAAEYKNDGHPFQALLFHDPAGNPAYYSPDGKSLQKAFLRSPLKFAAPITSHFSLSRFHPILKSFRPHLGIDYGAPTGTPVQSIGAGRVVFAGRKGGDGNMVRIAHSNGYETMYLHLSRILVSVGSRVEQGKIIGLVGMTGLATGPHLDFRILQHGEFRNFLALKLPASDPVESSDREAFASARDRWMPLLDAPTEFHARTAQEESAPPAPGLVAPASSR